MRSYCPFDYTVEWFYKDKNGKPEKVPFRFFRQGIKKDNVQVLKIHYQELKGNENILIRLTTKINGKDLKCNFNYLKLFLGELSVEDKPGPISGVMADYPKYFRWTCQKTKKIGDE